MDNVEIQTQDSTGNWRTYSLTVNNPQAIRAAMEQLKWQFPDQRVRAIDQQGRLVDMLG